MDTRTSSHPEKSITPGRNYFILVFALCSVMLMVFTTVIYHQSRISNEYYDAVITSYDILGKARRVLVYAVNLETGQRGYLLTGIEPYLAPYNTALNNLDKQMRELKEQGADDEEQKKAIANLDYHLRRLKNILKEQILAYQTEGPSGITVAKLNLSKSRMEQVRISVEKVITNEQDILKKREAASRRQNYNYFLTLFLGAALAVGGLVLANGFILRLLSRQRKTEADLRHFEESYRLMM